MSHHSTLNPTGWFSKILQTNHIGAIFALVFSITLTACGGGGEERTDIGPEPGSDGVAPTLVSVTMYNQFNDSSEVKLGETVQLDFTASESLMKPTVTIGGLDATVSGQHNSWSAELTMSDETYADGDLTFSISFMDVSGVAGVAVTALTEGDMVAYCKEGCGEGESTGIVGDWKLAPEAGSLGVGPAQGDIGWWSAGADTPTDRACLYDDIYRFGADGTFSNVQDGSTWMETWQGVDEGCGAPIEPHDGSNAATYTYDEDALTITLDGLGAYLGIAKAVNGAELTTPADATASNVYTISAMTDTTMTLDIAVGNGWWRFKFVKVPEDDAIVGYWKLAPEAGSLGVGPAQGDIGWWSAGADTPTDRACLYDDMYYFGADGTFSNLQEGSTWMETWQGVDEGCGAPISPHDGSNAATYTHDEDALTLTLDGTGAYLGIPKAVNGAELANPADAPESNTYTISAMTDTTMTLDIAVGNGWWRFKFVKVDVPAIAGDWKLTPAAGSLGVGPAQGDIGWWSAGADTPTDRACLYDDIYRFGPGGTFSNVQDGSTWMETWQGVDEGCGAPVAPHDSSNAATYTYDEDALTITLDGTGAYLGIPKAVNGAELANVADAPESNTYTISAMTDTTMTLDIAVGNGWWRFLLTKQ